MLGKAEEKGPHRVDRVALRLERERQEVVVLGHGLLTTDLAVLGLRRRDRSRAASDCPIVSMGSAHDDGHHDVGENDAAVCGLKAVGARDLDVAGAAVALGAVLADASPLLGGGSEPSMTATGVDGVPE